MESQVTFNVQSFLIFYYITGFEMTTGKHEPK